jgi:hypothetical protein
MANPQYGKSFHELKAKSGDPISLTPSLAGTNATSAIWVSGEVRDIAYKAGGDLKEYKGVDGEYEAITASGFYYDITFTLLPAGTSKANALLSTTLFDVGTPFTVANAPVIPVHGHTAEASPRLASVLNGVMYLQSMDLNMSVDQETTGTITLRHYPALSSVTVL